jgi:hypothetical protein
VKVVRSVVTAVIMAIAGVVIHALFLPGWEDEEAEEHYEVDLAVDEDDEDPET